MSFCFSILRLNAPLVLLPAVQSSVLNVNLLSPVRPDILIVLFFRDAAATLKRVVHLTVRATNLAHDIAHAFAGDLVEPEVNIAIRPRVALGPVVGPLIDENRLDDLNLFFEPRAGVDRVRIAVVHSKL